MTFLIAANHRFKRELARCKASLEKHGYTYHIYDLGGLGEGKPCLVQNNTFQTLGYYRTIYQKHPSRALHKPRIILDFLLSETPGTVFCYLDADVEVVAPIDEIDHETFDVGLTVHPVEHRFILGWLNAGVLFFRVSEKTQQFVDVWIEQTELHGNDQLGLKRTVLTFPGPIVKEFDGAIYNYRKVNDEPYPPTAKVIHHMASITDPAMHRLWQMRGGKG